MERTILISLFLCCLFGSVIGQNRQKIECRTTTIRHIVIDTVPVQEVTDLSRIGVQKSAICVKRSTIAYHGQDSAVQLPKCQMLFFDEKGNQVKHSNPMMAESCEAETQNNVYAYNKLQEVVRYDADGKEIAHLKYHYNSKGDVVGCDSVSAQGSKPMYEFKYDRYHNITYQKNYSSSPDACEFIFHYTYDPVVFGRILVKNVDRRNILSGQIYNYTTTYIYNEQGQVEQEQMVETNGEKSLIVYTYNESNQLVRKDMNFPDATLREDYVRDAFNSIIGTYYYVDNQLQYKTTNDIMYRNMNDNIAVNPIAAAEISSTGTMSTTTKQSTQSYVAK